MKLYWTAPSTPGWRGQALKRQRKCLLRREAGVRGVPSRARSIRRNAQDVHYGVEQLAQQLHKPRRIRCPGEAKTLRRFIVYPNRPLLIHVISGITP